MPTGSEYTDVRFGQQDQSYKQTDREMSPGIEPQVGGPNASTPAGNYPNVYDREAGSESLGPTEGEVYYPQRVFDHITCTGPGQSYVTTERESVSGEYGQCEATGNGPYPGTDIVPSPTPSKQFSSKMTGNPEELLNSTRSQVEAHADLIGAYGYTMPVATMGNHPWLRDSLSNPGEDEPGAAEPTAREQIPMRRTR